VLDMPVDIAEKPDAHVLTAVKGRVCWICRLILQKNQMHMF
jgi:hypothetical protein